MTLRPRLDKFCNHEKLLIPVELNSPLDDLFLFSFYGFD